MPFLRLELDAMPKIVPCAKAAHVEPGTILWGLAQAWEWCWREKETAVTDMQLEGFFGGNIAPALRAFGFLKEPQDGRHPIAGAEKYLRITQGRKAGGEASKGNLVPRQSQTDPNEVSRKTQGDPKAIPRPNDLGFIGSTASSEQRSASSEQRIGVFERASAPPLGSAAPPPQDPSQNSDAEPPLRERMDSVWLERHGTAFVWTFQDEQAMHPALQKANGSEEVLLARWRSAVFWEGFPTCGSVVDLVRHWNPYGSKPKQAHDRHKAPVRAEDIPKDSFANPGRVEDF